MGCKPPLVEFLVMLAALLRKRLGNHDELCGRFQLEMSMLSLNFMGI